MYAEAPGGPGGADASLMASPSYPVPTSAAHIVDRVESGGARVEETLLRFNLKYQTLFFAAHITCMAAGVVGALTSIASFEMASLVNSLFLIVSGATMSLTDVPGSPRWASRYRAMVRRHARILTRLSGKACFLLFLGCLSVCTLWPTHPGRSGSGSLVMMAVCVAFFVVGVSVLGLLIAVRKSVRLEKVRKAVLISCKGVCSEAYRKYAMTDPAHGLQLEEFNRLAADNTAGRTQFDITDLGIIYNALDEHQKSAINEREFTEWLTGQKIYC